MLDLFKLTGNQNTCSERVIDLTAQISNALDFTITGIQYPIKFLLEKGMSYCLTAQFQSDRIEGEYGTWRNMNGDNYYISAGNIQSCMELQRLEFFSKLKGSSI